MNTATRMMVLVCAVAAALGRQYPDAGDPSRRGLSEFLAWAHPRVEGCDAPDRIEVLERRADLMRVRYEVPCGSRTVLEAILRTREGEGVWQVAGGFETSSDRIEEALGTAGLRNVAAAMGDRAEGPDLAAGVALPTVDDEFAPEYPEEAGRARLIGQATVELLVDVAPDGTPSRARSLRGPDPDLGMRGAAIDAVLRWRFHPGTVAGRPVRSFTAVSIPFGGLPPDSSRWVHRALFHVEGLAVPLRATIEEALRRVASGEPFAQVAAELAPSGPPGGDWGLVSAAALPAPVRAALHGAAIGAWIDPVAADGLTYLMRKRGEIYYAIRSATGAEVSYQVVHQRNGPGGDERRRAIQNDIAAYMADRTRTAYANEAARVMGLRQRRTQIGKLVIHTDVLGDDEVEMLGRIVGEAIRAHEEFWSPIAPLRPITERILVYAFARQEDHDRLNRIWSGGRREGGRTSAGEYIPSSRILAIPCEATGGHLPVPIVLHEAIHMLNYERVYRADATPSKWFEEGLANYFGLSQFDSRLRLDPGQIRRSGTLTAGDARLQFDPRAQLREHLHRRRDEGAVPLQRLLEADSTSPLWAGDRSSRAYGAAWTLVHFLMHADRGRYREKFLEYARLESLGTGGAGAFRGIFGPGLARLGEAWHAYEEGL